MADPTVYEGETQLTRLRAQITNIVEMSELDRMIPTQADSAEDSQCRYNYLKRITTKPILKEVVWQNEMLPMLPDNIKAAMLAHPDEFAEQTIKWNRKELAWSSQLQILRSITKHTVAKAQAIYKSDTELLTRKVAELKDDLEVSQAETTSAEDRVKELETQLATANTQKMEWFNKHHEVLTKNNELTQRLMNGEGAVGEGSIGHSSRNNLRLPNPEELHDKSTAKEWKHWNMDMRNKITQERYDDSGAKAYILNRVKGGPTDGLMILHSALG